MITYLAFLAVAPAGMAVSYWRGRRAEERRHIQAFADNVETWLGTRRRG